MEANPRLIKKLRSERPGDTVLNYAVSTVNDDTIDFYILSDYSLSTMDYKKFAFTGINSIFI